MVKPENSTVGAGGLRLVAWGEAMTLLSAAKARSAEVRQAALFLRKLMGGNSL